MTPEQNNAAITDAFAARFGIPKATLVPKPQAELGESNEMTKAHEGKDAKFKAMTDRMKKQFEEFMLNLGESRHPAAAPAPRPKKADPLATPMEVDVPGPGEALKDPDGNVLTQEQRDQDAQEEDDDHEEQKLEDEDRHEQEEGDREAAEIEPQVSFDFEG